MLSEGLERSVSSSKHPRAWEAGVLAPLASGLSQRPPRFVPGGPPFPRALTGGLLLPFLPGHRYLYLLFSEDDMLSLEDWVFNTEAHPLPVNHSDSTGRVGDQL